MCEVLIVSLETKCAKNRKEKKEEERGEVLLA